MSYKKHFKTNTSGTMSPISGASSGNKNYSADFGYRNWGSSLPDVYTGHPNRIERYNQYESMDQDPEINGALDTIAEFATQESVDTGTAITVKYHQSEQVTDTENEIITSQLKQWYNLQEFDKRIHKLFRNVCKYGDQVFVRDPETFQLFWADMHKVTKVVVNESQGKKPEQYFIKDLGPNFQNLTATTPTTTDTYQAGPSVGGTGGDYSMPNQGYTGGNRFSTDVNEGAYDAEHIVHFSLTEGLDTNWPFGVSMLETVFKTFKQKELLEDAILIYRVQRAPERRVFYIDVGNMPTHKARAHLERIKNEIHQRRIPSKTGGGQTVTDSAYNPLSIMEDYFFAQTAEGRGSKVETLPGGENLGQIDDLKYFNDKLLRGLRVPASYLGGMDDGGATVNDGRVGTAMIAEFRFTKFCERLQALIVEQLDNEFKMFCKNRGVQVESSRFSLQFNTPQNFGKFRQAEVDQVAMNVFSSIEGADYISKRFALQRFLGLTEDEILENEKLWREENGGTDELAGASDNLKGVGAAPAPADVGGNDDFDFDETDVDDTEDGSVIDGSENAETDEEV